MTRERYGLDFCVSTTFHGDFWLGIQECASLEDARILLDYAKAFSDKFVILVIAKLVNGDWEQVEFFDRRKQEQRKVLH